MIKIKMRIKKINLIRIFYFVENFYIFDKTSTFLLLEKTGKRIIIHKKTKKIEDKNHFQIKSHKRKE